MIDINNLQLRKLDLENVRTLLKWAEEEGWNPGQYDADVFRATDPDGFYGYYYHDTLIAGGAIISYNGEFGFMGLFIVKPEYRKIGVGRKLWFQRRDMLLNRLKKGATIGMDGVLAMQSFYEKGGFKIAFRDERYEKTGMSYSIDKNIFPIDNDFESVLAYDKKCFGFERADFLKQWLKLPNSKAFKYVEKGEFKGFAIVRKVLNGYKICPLFADDEEVASALYEACLNISAGEKFYLDIPVKNKCAVNLIQKYKATFVFECARMYYGKEPDIAIDNIFGITTFELG